MRSVRVLAGAALLALGAAAACSKSSTAPPPSVAGTWHVAIGTMTVGGFNPPTFDVTLTQNGTVYGGTIPTEGWGGYPFNQNPTVMVVGDSLYASLDVAPIDSMICAQLGIIGTFNSAHDTLRGIAYVAPSQTNMNPASCSSHGPFVATR